MARAMARTFKDLVVWQKAHRWVLDVYRFSKSFPAHELYGLTSQVRRAAVSVPANLAEGFRRRGHADKTRMLNIAQSSLAEAEYCLILAQDLNYGATNELTVQLEEVSKLLEAYTSTILTSSS